VKLPAMVAYRLRIELPDRPGALAGVTSEIADSEANILSIDVHEVDGGTAIDEIVVEVPDGWAPGALAASMAMSGVGNLLSSRLVVTSDDPVTAALDAVVAMVTGSPADVDAACCAALLSLALGSSARLLDAGAAALDPTGRLAVDRSGPIVHRADDGGGQVSWVLAAPDDATDPRTVALVTRPVDMRFSATEVSRVEALLRIRRSLLAGRATLA
jgi:hypothetical protein